MGPCLKTQLENMLHHPFTASLVLICFSLLLHKLMIKAFRSSRKGNPPPSPPTIPIIGNLHQQSKLAHRSLSDLSKRYGPVMLINFGSVPAIVVSSAEAVKQIKKDQDIPFANRSTMAASDTLLHGKTGLTSAPYGDYWREIRKLCITGLLSKNRVQSFNFIREEEIAQLIDGVAKSCLAKVPINLSEILEDASFNILVRCITGKKPQEGDGERKFRELVVEYTKMLSGSGLEVFPWLGWMNILTGFSSNVKRLMVRIDAYLDQMIDQHNAESKSDDMDHSKDFIGILDEFQQDNPHSINFPQRNIKAIIMDMFAAGNETTTVTMQWAMAELINNPSAMRKAQEEVRNVVGNASKVNEEDIDRMDYLKAIIKETLRLHPPISFLPMEPSTNGVLNGYHVPANTLVLVNVWEVNREVKTWDKADEFIPERFINIPIDFRGQHFEYIPFGAGRRGCPGISFSIAVVELVLANLIFWFDWELPAGASRLDMSEICDTSLYMKTPIDLVPKLHFS